jgi:hypothetical protein
VLKAKCRHGNVLCSQCIVADDAAKRAWEQVKNIAVHNDWETRVNSVITIRLSDGHCDGVLYDSKQAAVKHCKGNEQWYAFFSFRNAPNGFASPRDAAVFLAYHRLAYDNGFRLPDPDDAHGGPDMIMPTPEEHVMDQLGRLMRAAVN